MSDHYKHAECETVDFIEEVLSSMAVTPTEAWQIGNALKYACRAGYKDDWKEDAHKCADYLNRYKTGEWLW